MGIKNPEAIAVPSVRNDAAFLVTVTLTTSVAAVIAGAVLPGDWGFFTSCEAHVCHPVPVLDSGTDPCPFPLFRQPVDLIGGITLGVLAVGSTAPGLLQFAIDKFSLLQPVSALSVLEPPSHSYALTNMHTLPT